ncbi:MAG TPA: 50S ribosomal protein L19e [archaeon]|nr:50S ribosomal protein L19e [archaeon]
MMENKAKKTASGILKVGKTKIWVNPEERQRVLEAMTKEDIRLLIKDGIIRKRKDSLHSRARARVLKEKKRRGRKKGRGKRTGRKTARTAKKEKWMKNVRAQRRAFAEMKKTGMKFARPASEIYLMIKGGYFKGKKHLQSVAEGKAEGKGVKSK